MCSQSLHGIVRNQKKVFSSLRNIREQETITYQMNNASVCCWKRTTVPFVIRNEQRFKNLHGVVGKKERFRDKKFLNAIAYLQSEILIFLVFVSSGNLTFFSGDITNISGNMTQVSGDMTLGEMTLGRLDRLP